MRNQLSVLLIASLLITSSFGSYPATTYTTAPTCTSQVHLSAVPTVACATAAACTAGYSDNAPASATTNSAATSTAAADCKYCALNYVWSSTLYAACVSTTGGPCATGYSDVAPTLNVNAAASTNPTGNCAYCATSYFQTSTMVGVTAATTFTCTNSAACTTGYSDKAPVSGANTAASTTAAANCIYCAPTYYWDSLLDNNCILKTGTSTCATGYSDNTNGTASAAGSLTGNCVNCASTYYFDRANGITGQTCILKTGTSTCATGYSDVAPVNATTNSAASAAGSLTGNCVNCAVLYAQDRLAGVTGETCVLRTSTTLGTCATGYSDVAPVNATTNSAASAAGSLTGNCVNCAVSYFMDRPSSVTGVSCVLKTSTTLGVCATGYADASTGVASAAGSLAGNCKYCLTGYSDVAPVNATTNVAATAAGAVAACKYCAPGYTQTAVGSACTVAAATSANFMMVSISMLATLIMIIF